MASVEHCLFCFEALSAKLEHRKALTLAQVKKSWASYVEATSKTPAAATKLSPALRRLAAGSSSSTSSSSSSTSSASNSSLSLGGQSTPATSISSATSEVDDEVPATEDEEEEEITESPLFVTWNIDHPRHGHILRGCIGTFEPQELEDGLSSYALISALQDHRFSPISAKELPALSVSVTLLTNFEEAADPMDWELGKHGIRISFVYHGKRYGSTYLPDVAVEQGWDKEEALISLIRKAGWVGKREKWQDLDIKLVRYQGKKKSLEYEDFKQWREWESKSDK
ncbi:AMMECR1-like protein [Podospora australis]|uniref:AMMECR1-like protein n=1 Tax=Podospora australis TaxID=1536484 RepID=A0AAN6X261_9PEZI|nr:AMMECR1-like protein [Podospora australis]